MDTFAANYLADLTADLSAQILNVAGRKLRQSLQGTEGEQALQRAVRAGVLALLATASGAASEEANLLEDIFTRFFAEPDVVLELTMLLRGQALEVGVLSDLFSEVGFDAETLPGVDFEQGLAAFEAAFLLSAGDESSLRDIVATGQLLAQTRLQGEMLVVLRELVDLLQRTGGSSISVQRGKVIAQGGSVAGGRESINVGGAVYGGITIVHQHTAIGKPDFSRDYCEALRQRCNVLPLAALGGEEEAGDEVTLDEVYIALDTTTPGREGGKSNREIAVEETGREERTLTALEAATRYQRLALLGEPGGGKSTFVRQLAARLAAAHLAGEAMTEGWDQAVLPVMITLRELAARLAGLELQGLSQDATDQQLVETVWEQWRHDLKYETRIEGFAADLERALREGNVVLMFDGLDEVTLALRPLVRKALAAVQRHYPKVRRLIVTCRVRSYTGSATLSGFTACTLAPFDEDKIRDFCTAWYSAQSRMGRVKRDQVGTRIRDFREAALSDDLQEMASNPMLLTTMAIIHQRDIGLPKERVRLFNEAVKVLIERWQRHKGITAPLVLASVLGDDLKLRRILEMIAYEAHQVQAKQGPDARLARVELLTLLERPALLGDMNCAVEFLDYVDQRAGLLVGHGGDEEGEQPLNYDFAHRSFQEYLAGCQMVSQGQPARAYWQRVKEGDFWHQAALYGAEDLLFNRRLPPALRDLAYRLCPAAAAPVTEADWRALVWSGQMAVLLDKENILADDEDRDGGAAYFERLLQRLQGVLTSSPLNPFERADAGKALAALGDPRKGVGLRSDGLPDIDWVLVPEIDPQTGKGEWIYQNGKRKPEPDFWIARYPVTYAQFQAFLGATDGFRRAEWWQGLSADKDYQKKPGRQYFQHLNHPRENVNWYDALAFCRWLTAKAREAPDLLPAALNGASVWQITLPTEWQWEKAARGHEGRQYPWGQGYQSGRANVDEINSKVGPYYLQQTSAVGMYPHATRADSPYGVADLSGNVWEWCLNEYDHPDQVQSEGSERRVVRGGAWNYDPNLAASAFRLRYHPTSGSTLSAFGWWCGRRPFSSVL